MSEETRCLECAASGACRYIQESGSLGPRETCRACGGTGSSLVAELTRKLAAAEQENADLREMLSDQIHHTEIGSDGIENAWYWDDAKISAALAAKAAERAQPEST